MIALFLGVFFSVCLAPSQAADTVPGNCENPPLDISIVIDRTKSVGAKNYDKMLDSVKDLISSYEVGKDKTHFSIVTFADQAEVRVSLGDSKYYSKAALHKRLDEMKAKDKLGGVTRTDRALKTVGEEVFVKKNGDRPGSPNVMIILTDGATNKLSEPYDTVLPTLENKGVQRVAVGIGKDVKQSELETIAGNKDRVINAENFGDLNEKLKDISEAVCNIDGGYTEWSKWSKCSATCGEGVRYRSRTCTNPPPKNDGKTCTEQKLGPPKQSQKCNSKDCPVPGGYTNWSNWRKCSVTCGGGVQTRSRTCTNPPPSGGGPTCTEQKLGPNKQTRKCNSKACPVPGGYTNWSNWGKCSVTCGGGVQTRSRTCTNPPPSGGGPTCTEQKLGPKKQSRKCNSKKCPVPGGYTNWSNWGKCSVTCGGGVQTRSRTCTNPPPSGGGPTCTEQNLGPAKQTQGCNRQSCPTPEPPPPKPCKEHLDVGVIIDSSGSIRPNDYVTARNFIITLAERLEISELGTHMAILLYSFEAHVWHRFTDAQTTTAIRSAAYNLPHIRGGTRTDRALKLAADEFFGWADSGDRPDKPNVLIVMTDGNTNPGSAPFHTVTGPLDAANVRRIAVGIGNEIDLRELREIASKPEDAMRISFYSQLTSILEEIMDLACDQKNLGPCDKWGSYGDCSKTCGGGVQVRSRSCPAYSLFLMQQKRHCNTNLCPGQEPCVDKDNTSCPLEAAAGDCWATAKPEMLDRNTGIILGGFGKRRFPLWDTCPKSCQRCNVDPSCYDKEPYLCTSFAAQGKCFQSSVAASCQLSCKRCTPGGGGGAGGGGGGGGEECKDISSNCWSNKWQCGFNKFVQDRCKKTCNLCSSGGGGSNGGYGGGGRPGGYGGGGRPGGYGGGGHPGGYGGGGRPGGYGGGGRPGGYGGYGR